MRPLVALFDQDAVCGGKVDRSSTHRVCYRVVLYRPSSSTGILSLSQWISLYTWSGEVVKAKNVNYFEENCTILTSQGCQPMTHLDTPFSYTQLDLGIALR